MKRNGSKKGRLQRHSFVPSKVFKGQLCKRGQSLITKSSIAVKNINLLNFYPRDFLSSLATMCQSIPWMLVPVQDSPFLSNKSSGLVRWQTLRFSVFPETDVFPACFPAANTLVPPREILLHMVSQVAFETTSPGRK